MNFDLFGNSSANKFSSPTSFFYSNSQEKNQFPRPENDLFAVPPPPPDYNDDTTSYFYDDNALSKSKDNDRRPADSRPWSSDLFTLPDNIYDKVLDSQMPLFDNAIEEEEVNDAIMNEVGQSDGYEDTFVGNKDESDFVSNYYYSSPATLQSPNVHGSSCNNNESNEEGLKSTLEIPEPYRAVFPFTNFNLVQSKVLNDMMYHDNPVVVCAPTGSGKTVLFELAIIRLLLRDKRSQSKSYKTVYMAPIKALCTERFNDWNNKFGKLNIKCVEVTGDSDVDDLHQFQDANIVFTTPEKWDSLTRKWKDNKTLMQAIRLFLVDEVHLLGDGIRGATIEAVISRMKTVQLSIAKEHHNVDQPLPLRFVAVSATIPNVEDVSEWLSTSDNTAIYHCMGEEFRPVRLRKVVLGYPCNETQSEFRFDLSLNYKLSSIIQTYSDCKPTIVFCSTRKSVCQAAATLVKSARFIFDGSHKTRLLTHSSFIKDFKLRDLVLNGVGFHHAGLEANDRRQIETMFSRGDLPVLFCTSTLAMGVNLPAHLVIVKSTMHYIRGLYEEYSESQILQMIGRAGRPQFDSTATAVIMTKMQTKMKYECLISGSQNVESSLHKNLIEHINAELVLGTITDVTIAQDWLKSTFLFQRIQKNPEHYGAPKSLEKGALTKKLQAMCTRALKSLSSLELVEFKPSGDLTPTETGRLMARYCIAYDTVELFSKSHGNESLEDLMEILSKAKEFEDIKLRTNEKKILNTLNSDKHRTTIRFPMKGRIKTTDQKISCLLQSVMGCLPINEFALSQDITKIFRSGQRVTKFLMEYMFQKGKYKGAISATILYKCFRARLWENSSYVARQLERVGQAMCSALVNAGVSTFDKIIDTNPRELEMIVNRHPPFGNQIRDSAAALPRIALSVDQAEPKQPKSAHLTITIELKNLEVRRNYLKIKKPIFQHCVLLLVGDSANNIVFKQRIMDSQLIQTGIWTRKINVICIDRSSELNIHVISQDLVGLDISQKFTPKYTTDFHQNINDSFASRGNDRTQSRKDTNTGKTSSCQKAECNHKCRNKAWCGHKCCKESSQNLQSQPHSSIKQTPKQMKEKKVQGNLGSFYDLMDSKSCKTPQKDSVRIKPKKTDTWSYTPKKLKMSNEGIEHHTDDYLPNTSNPETKPKPDTHSIGSPFSKIDAFKMLRTPSIMPRNKDNSKANNLHPRFDFGIWPTNELHIDQKDKVSNTVTVNPPVVPIRYDDIFTNGSEKLTKHLDYSLFEPKDEHRTTATAMESNVKAALREKPEQEKGVSLTQRPLLKRNIVKYDYKRQSSAIDSIDISLTTPTSTEDFELHSRIGCTALPMQDGNGTELTGSSPADLLMKTQCSKSKPTALYLSNNDSIEKAGCKPTLHREVKPLPINANTIDLNSSHWKQTMERYRLNGNNIDPFHTQSKYQQFDTMPVVSFDSMRSLNSDSLHRPDAIAIDNDLPNGPATCVKRPTSTNSKWFFKDHHETSSSNQNFDLGGLF